VIICCISAALFFVFKPGEEKVVVAEKMPMPEVQAPAPAPPETAAIGSEQDVIQFKGFIVLAPLEREDLTFILADVEINLTDGKMASQIKKHEAFFRSVIYDVIQKAFASTGDASADQFDLKMAIKDALNRSMPEEAVKAVSFMSFVLG